MITLLNKNYLADTINKFTDDEKKTANIKACQELRELLDYFREEVKIGKSELRANDRILNLKKFPSNLNAPPQISELNEGENYSDYVKTSKNAAETVKRVIGLAEGLGFATRQETMTYKPKNMILSNLVDEEKHYLGRIMYQFDAKDVSEFINKDVGIFLIGKFSKASDNKLHLFNYEKPKNIIVCVRNNKTDYINT